MVFYLEAEELLSTEEAAVRYPSVIRLPCEDRAQAVSFGLYLKPLLVAAPWSVQFSDYDPGVPCPVSSESIRMDLGLPPLPAGF